MNDLSWERLEAEARRAQARAYAPYSGFPVGAAVLVDGAVVGGCNVENRSYGATLCAERTALVAAVAAGHLAGAPGTLRALCVVTPVDPPAPPCGLCLQALAEFAAPDLPVRLLGAGGGRRDLRLGDLLPFPFRSPIPGARY